MRRCTVGDGSGPAHPTPLGWPACPSSSSASSSSAAPLCLLLLPRTKGGAAGHPCGGSSSGAGWGAPACGSRHLWPGDRLALREVRGGIPAAAARPPLCSIERSGSSCSWLIRAPAFARAQMSRVRRRVESRAKNLSCIPRSRSTAPKDSAGGPLQVSRRPSAALPRVVTLMLTPQTRPLFTHRRAQRLIAARLSTSCVRLVCSSLALFSLAAGGSRAVWLSDRFARCQAGGVGASSRRPG